MTEVQPLWVPSEAASWESRVSTRWKVLLRRSGIGVVGEVRRASRRCCEVREVSLACGERREGCYFVKVLAAPFGGVLACVAVKDSKVALASDPSKVVNERVCTRFLVSSLRPQGRETKERTLPSSADTSCSDRRSRRL